MLAWCMNHHHFIPEVDKDRVRYLALPSSPITPMHLYMTTLSRSIVLVPAQMSHVALLLLVATIPSGRWGVASVPSGGRRVAAVSSILAVAGSGLWGGLGSGFGLGGCDRGCHDAGDGQEEGSDGQLHGDWRWL